MNSDYITQAMAKVGNANVLVNLVSKRVRQLMAGGNRPLIDQGTEIGPANIALLEIIHGKMDYSISALTQEEEEVQPVAKKRRRA